MLMRATPESPRMFERDWIDGFSRTPWWTIPLFWLPIIGWLLSLSLDGLGVAHLLGGFLGGWLIWTLTEYLLHRSLFHWTPPFRWGPRLHFILHGVHHEWVQDRYRLVMPPAMGLIMAVPFVLGFRALFGPTWFGVLMAGFFFGYVVYDLLGGWTVHEGLKARLAFRNLGDLSYRVHGSGLNSPGVDLRATLNYRY